MTHCIFIVFYAETRETKMTEVIEIERRVWIRAGYFLTFANTHYAGMPIDDHPSSLPFRYVETMEVFNNLPSDLKEFINFHMEPSVNPYLKTFNWANDGQVHVAIRDMHWRAIEREELAALNYEVEKLLRPLTKTLRKNPSFSKVEPAPHFSPFGRKAGEKVPDWHFDVFSRLNRTTTMYDN